ncbi:rhodanese-like domain-containing protein, partial [Patescibacteria group bacterium]|nr:rhodanese-like domain-containing protein [Patescibacteria group bacterium]
DHDDEEEHENDQTYHSITPKELSIVLAQQNAVLVDVHIPEQEHLPKTDLFIPYNAIGDNLNKLPGKEAPIVLYCRSGGMSRAAAYILAEHGYTNVYDLVGGKNAYDAWLRDTAIEQ